MSLHFQWKSLACATFFLQSAAEVRMAEQEGSDSQPLSGTDQEDRGEERASPEPKERILDVGSPRSEGDSIYVDAPSRLEESVLSAEDPPATKDATEDDTSGFKDNDSEPAETEKPPEAEDSFVTSPQREHECLSPGVGDKTIYASATESFLSEAGDQGDFKPAASPLDEVSENEDGTDDPLGLDEVDSNASNAEEKEDGEEGELDADVTAGEEQNASAYQTEPVSSDEDGETSQDAYSNRDAQKDNVSNPGVSQSNRTEDLIQNGHKSSNKTDHDLNHEDHVELDYEEDLDDGERVKDRLEDEDKVN